MSSLAGMEILDPDDHKTLTLYRLMTSVIVPRPIGWVSTLSEDGVLNLAPFSYFQGVASKPPLLSLCIGRRGRERRKKDTLVNIEATREFVVNIVDEDLAAACVLSSGEFDPDVDEFAFTGLETAPSRKIKPPRVARSPIAMECVLERAIDLADDTITMVIGEVKLFQIREGLRSGDTVDIAKLRPMARLGAALYAPIREVIEIPRP